MLSRRDAVVGELRGWLEAASYPRLHATFIVSVAGGAAFLASLLLLGSGVESMAFRYLAAGCTGYLTFVLMIRGWIAWQRNRADLDLPLDMLSDVRLPRPEAEPPRLFFGGHSGGGGASGDWHSEALAPHSRSPTIARPPSPSAGGDWSLDADDLIWLVVAAAAALAGILAVGYVIYAAPVLLAEVALDAALVSTAYRKLRREDVGHWTGAVLRRTWLPATILIVSLVIAGYALQRVVPDARSIGGVVRALASR